jgi:probable F420-dependent oxidoreductase
MTNLAPSLDLGPTGAVLSPDQPAFVETAVELERLGFSAVWLSGGPLSSTSQVAEVLAATERILVGTAILAVDRFGPDEVIALYEAAEDDHPGRLVVGLGGAHRGDPFQTLTAYLDTIDGVVPAGRRVMAALGPRMLDLARERSAGALPIMITPAYAARAAARLGPDRLLAVEQLAVVETDPQRARQIARQTLGFFTRIPGYQASFRRQGFADETVGEVGDDLVDAVIACGTGSTIAARVDELRAAGARHVAINLLTDAPEAVAAGWAAIAEALINPQ